MKTEARNRMVDVLRGASAIAVALFHFNEPYPALPDFYHRLLKWGWLGVPVFFVVSGFCVAAARSKSELGPFWVRRLARILPPYWASLGVVLGVIALRVAITGTNDVTKLPGSIENWFFTLTALTSPASATPGMNWAYWSLGYELAFYVLLGLLGLGRSLSCLTLFSVAAAFVPGFPFDQWGLFGLGVACYHFTQGQRKSASILAAVCLANLVSRLTPPQAILGCVAALLILFPPQKVLTSVFRPLSRVGVFSYSLYLVHVPIGCYLLPHYLPWTSDRRLWSSLVQDAILLLACLVFSFVFYRVAEKPSHEFARRAYRGALDGKQASPA